MQVDENEKINTQTVKLKDIFKVFATSDERLKLLGEIFSNESSRRILTLILEKELTIMAISKESGISLNLIIHHLKKMIDADIVTITKETTNSRGRPLRFYRAKPAIVILSKDAASRADKSKSLRNTLGRVTRFGSIGVAGIVTWVFANSSHVALDSAFKYPRPTLPPYMVPIEPQSAGEPVFAAVLTACVVAAGLALNHLLKRFKK